VTRSLNSPARTGRFVVFDGMEGCGKSTQMKLLRDRLMSEGGRPVEFVRDPGSTRIGEQVRAILLNPDNAEMRMRCEMLLYMAARAQMMAETILPALAQGKLVVSDRFVSSTLAYQLGGDDLAAAEIRAVADVAIRGRWPDLTVILDLPTEVSMARVRPKFTLFPDDPDAGFQKDRIEQRPLEYHRRVRQNYLEQAKADPAKYRVIDASRDPQVVHEDVYSAVRVVMN
jgi:dTMP kinase